MGKIIPAKHRQPLRTVYSGLGYVNMMKIAPLHFGRGLVYIGRLGGALSHWVLRTPRRFSGLLTHL